MARRKGTPQTAEARAKMSASMVTRWKDPAYRAAQAARLRQQQAAASKASYAVRDLRPPHGTPERRWYEKVREILGAKAAAEALARMQEKAGAP